MIDTLILFIQTAGDRFIPIVARESVYAATLFGVIWVFQKLFRIRSPYLQTGLWLLVFFRLVLPPDWSLPFSGRSLIGHLFPQHSVESFGASEILEPVEVAQTPDAASQMTPGARIPDDAKSFLFALWILGVVFFFSLYIKRLSRYRRLIRSARRIETGEAVDLLEIWRKRFKIRRAVRLMTRSCAVSPFTLGVFRPVILIPENVFESVPRADLESVIAHEMAHVKRWDDLWITLQNLIQIGYFFHPLVWMAGSRLHLARECACDSLVLAQRRIDRAQYGRGLLNILTLQPFGPDCVALIPSLTGGRNTLITRFQNMKGAHTMRNKHKAGMILLLAGLALFVLPMAAVPLPDQSGGESSLSLPVAADDAKSPTFRLILPVQGGKIIAGFGERRDPIKQDVIQFHKGIDIPGKKGTPVLASADGVVTVAKARDYDPNAYGKYIVLQHPGGFETVYAQLDSILVQESASVKQGVIIGQVGQSGRSTGPHLHFEVRLDGEAVDPETYIEK